MRARRARRLPHGSAADDEDQYSDLLEYAARLDEAQLERFLKGLPAPVERAIRQHWFWQAHGGQQEPEACLDGSDWRVWLIRAGRGFGKTRVGAEWVWARARAMPEARIALVGANLDDVVKVMVEGESGLVAAARSDESLRWVASRWRVDFSTGAQAFAYSGERPGKLRGPQHHFAWCDEIAKWTHADAAWDNLMLGLRLGERPRSVVTTTPRPIAILKRIAGLERCVTTRGRTAENVHLPDDFRDAVTGMYAGTRLGRQELEGEMIEDVAGALFSRDLIERCRLFLPGRKGSGVGVAFVEAEQVGIEPTGSDPPPTPPLQGGEFERPAAPLQGGEFGRPAAPLQGGEFGRPAAPLQGGEFGRPAPPGEFGRIVIGVDPPAGVDGDACGIVVTGVRDGVGFVLADESVSGLSPEGWAAAVARAAARWRADRVVAEANQGGRMVESVLRAVERHLPLTLVHASEGKVKRAEPVAALFERGAAKFAGAFPALEDELAGLTVGGGYEGPGRSPDRADAMVWAMTELMLRETRAPPAVRVL